MDESQKNRYFTLLSAQTPEVRQLVADALDAVWGPDCAPELAGAASAAVARVRLAYARGLCANELGPGPTGAEYPRVAQIADAVYRARLGRASLLEFGRVRDWEFSQSGHRLLEAAFVAGQTQAARARLTTLAVAG